jgi:hypothetical protein
VVDLTVAAAWITVGGTGFVGALGIVATAATSWKGRGHAAELLRVQAEQTRRADREQMGA